MCRAERKVYEYIAEKGLTERGDEVAAAISGGADSVCLTLILSALARALGVKLCAVHVNHNFRADAGRDEDFCVKLCEKLNVPIRVYSVDMAAVAKERGLTLEEAGRELRYEAFRGAAEFFGADKVAVAHSKNDLAETVVMRLVRGTGTRGLIGIAPMRGNIVRPLLCLTRGEIEEYLRYRGQTWQTDETNALNDYTRNKTRNAVLPALNEIYGGDVVRALARSAEIAAADNDFIETYSRERLNEIRRDGGIDAKGLKKLHGAVAARAFSVFYEEEVGSLKDLSAERIAAAINLGSGKVIQAAGGVVVANEKGVYKIYSESS